MRLSPLKISFLQALGLFLYILIFVFSVRFAQNLPEPEDSVLGIGIFLMAFVISALACGSMALGYPAFLLLSGRGKEALKIVLGTLAWLVIFFSALLVLGLGVFA